MISKVNYPTPSIKLHDLVVMWRDDVPDHGNARHAIIGLVIEVEETKKMKGKVSIIHLPENYETSEDSYHLGDIVSCKFHGMEKFTGTLEMRNE